MSQNMIVKSAPSKILLSQNMPNVGNLFFCFAEDDANTFRFYQTTRLSRSCNLDPKQTMNRIYISKAFPAYQIAMLILLKLEGAEKTLNIKLVIISNIAAMFLYKDLKKEAKQICSQIINRLSKFAKESQTIIIATYLPHPSNPCHQYLEELTVENANVIIAIKQTTHEKRIILEKYPTLMLGSAKVPTEILPQTTSIGA